MERDIDMSVFLYDVQVSSNHAIGVKDKRQKKSYRNERKDSEAEKL